MVKENGSKIKQAGQKKAEKDKSYAIVNGLADVFEHFKMERTIKMYSIINRSFFFNWILDFLEIFIKFYREKKM